MTRPAPAEELCEVCDDRIEDPRAALGMTTCWRHASTDSSPPWDVGPDDVGLTPS